MFHWQRLSFLFRGRWHSRGSNVHTGTDVPRSSGARMKADAVLTIVVLDRAVVVQLHLGVRKWSSGCLAPARKEVDTSRYGLQGAQVAAGRVRAAGPDACMQYISNRLARTAIQLTRPYSRSCEHVHASIYTYIYIYPTMHKYITLRYYTTTYVVRMRTRAYTPAAYIDTLITQHTHTHMPHDFVHIYI